MQQQRGDDNDHETPAAAHSNCANLIPESESAAPDTQVVVASIDDSRGGKDVPNTIFAENHSSASISGQWSLSQHLGIPLLEDTSNYYDLGDPTLDIFTLHDEEPDWSSLLPPPSDRVEGISDSPVRTGESLAAFQNGPGDDSPADDLSRCQTVGVPESRRVRDISDVSSSLSTYFFQDVLSRYCTWDSNSNIMRIIIETMWQSSGALYHTMQSMAASCLSNELPQFARIAEQERQLALQFVKDTRMREDRLLAAFLLGHTFCWVNPADLVPNQFKEFMDDAVVLLGLSRNHLDHFICPRSYGVLDDDTRFHH